MKLELCIDVGANYGEFIGSITDLNLKSLAIEANPTLIKYLKKSFENFSYISIINAALLDIEGEKDFYYNPQYSGSGSFSEKTALSGSMNKKQKVLKTKGITTRLDRLIQRELNVNPKHIILKIDAEGYDHLIFSSVLTILGKCKWWRAIIEFSPDSIKKNNLNPQKIWDEYNKFFGCIIKNKIELKKCKNIPFKLSKDYPKNGCDILIGKGIVD